MTASRLAGIVESSDDAIVSKNLDGIIMSWNRAAERMFGYTAEEAIGKSITLIIPQDRLSEEAHVLSQVRAGQRVDHFETIRRRKDGSLIPISLTISPIRDAQGRIVGASKTARDITERRAEAALAAAEARQSDLQRRLVALVAGSRALFDSPRVDDVLPAILALARTLIPADGYSLCRLDGTTSSWQIAAALGLSDGFCAAAIDSSGFTSVARVPFSDPLVVESVQHAPIFAERADLYHREGIESLMAVPLDIHGRGTGTLVFYYRTRHAFSEVEVDTARALSNLAVAAITTAEMYDEQRRLRLETARAYEQANDANRAKDEFVATVSHELRTPLNALLGWARMLRAGSLDPGKVTRAYEAIERNAMAQLNLVDDLLDLSRIVTGKFRLEVERVDLAAVIAAAVEVIQPSATAKGITLTVATEPDRCTVRADPSRLQQAVWNLLSNAIKFTPAGGSVTMTIARRSASQIEIGVTDTGEGIDASVLPYVFDRFRQGESGTTRTHTGLGLGLAIVQHIVELHGGRVEARSEGRGKGSTFVIALPVSSEAAGADIVSVDTGPMANRPF